MTNLPVTMPGLKFGAGVLGKDSSRSSRYTLIKENDLPLLTVGKLQFVIVRPALEKLGIDPDEFAAALGIDAPTDTTRTSEVTRLGVAA